MHLKTTTTDHPDANRDRDEEAVLGGGDAEAVGRALEGCRQYLTLVAEHALGDDLRAKATASDLVQETFLEAHRDFDRFRGRTEDELRAWLFGILRHNLLNLARHYRGTDKRRLDREVPLNCVRNVGRVAAGVAAEAPSPSDHAIRREQNRALARALGRLPEHYRSVLAWRHQEKLPFEVIGHRLESSAEAARKLWARAVDRLRWEIEHGEATDEPTEDHDG